MWDAPVDWSRDCASRTRRLRPRRDADRPCGTGERRVALARARSARAVSVDAGRDDRTAPRWRMRTGRQPGGSARSLAGRRRSEGVDPRASRHRVPDGDARQAAVRRDRRCGDRARRVRHARRDRAGVARPREDRPGRRGHSGVELLFSADEEVGSHESTRTDRGTRTGVRQRARARTVGRRWVAQDRPQGLRHLRGGRRRASCPRRVRARERGERADRDDAPGVGDQPLR